MQSESSHKGLDQMMVLLSIPMIIYLYRCPTACLKSLSPSLYISNKYSTLVGYRRMNQSKKRWRMTFTKGRTQSGCWIAMGH